MHRPCMIFLGAIFLLSCQKKSDPAPPIEGRIAKRAVDFEMLKSESGCMSLEKSFAEIKTLDLGLPVLVVSTKLDVKSKTEVRDGFQRSLAYGNFQYEEHLISDLQDFPPVHQEGCKTVLFEGPDDINEVYQVIESTDRSLTLESERHLKIRYQWISPQILQIENQFRAYDLPCSDETPILVEATKVLDWAADRGGPIPQTDSVLKIDPDFLKRFGEAIDRSSRDLYGTSDMNDEDSLRPDKLREFALAPPRDDLKTCNLSVRQPNAAPTEVAPSPVSSPIENEPAPMSYTR